MPIACDDQTALEWSWLVGWLDGCLVDMIECESIKQSAAKGNNGMQRITGEQDGARRNVERGIW